MPLNPRDGEHRRHQRQHAAGAIEEKDRLEGIIGADQFDQLDSLGALHEGFHVGEGVENDENARELKKQIRKV